jgi:signal transduction histidine kinase
MMFRKLRNRFLQLIMITISVLMLISFSAIYMITYQNVHSDIEMELHRAAEFGGRISGPKGGFGDENRMRGLPPVEPRPADDRTASFTILTDDRMNIVRIFSFFDADASFFSSMLEMAQDSGRKEGRLTVEGECWAYVVQEAPGGGYRLTFLDVTARQIILTNLIYTFVGTAVVMLVVIFFISRYFANRSLAPVQEAFLRQKQFIADASHELKTPLAIIRTNVDVLLANEQETIRSQSKWLGNILAETERMSRLTSDLLYLTQMDEAREQEATLYSYFQASEAAENVILTMEALIYEKNFRFEYDIQPDLTVYGNREQFQQVLMILLDNAVKYTNPRGEIRFSMMQQHHEAVILVANTGEGIARDQLDRIFDRFYRTDPARTRARGGYGLGLAIAKAIVERHKGRIYASSEPGVETVFHVHLPMHA